MGKEYELQEPGDQRGGRDPDGDRPASIQFLQRRSHHQEQQHVAEKVGHTGVPEDMPEKADIGKRIEQRGAVDGKDRRCRSFGREKTEYEGQQGNKEEAKNDGSVELQFFHGGYPPECGILFLFGTPGE